MQGGNVTVKSGKTGTAQNRALAINITNSGQLLSLLAAAPSPAPGGEIIIRATGANSDINVRGRVQADKGLIDIRHTAVTILTGVSVNIGGPKASVYVNSTGNVPNANYGRASGGNGNTTGQFTGSGANAPQPLSNALPIGPNPGG